MKNNEFLIHSVITWYAYGKVRKKIQNLDFLSRNETLNFNFEQMVFTMQWIIVKLQNTSSTNFTRLVVVDLLYQSIPCKSEESVLIRKSCWQVFW